MRGLGPAPQLADAFPRLADQAPRTGLAEQAHLLGVRFYRRDGRYLIRRPPRLRPESEHITYAQVRNLWLHTARLREAAGDIEGAARARQNALGTVQLCGYTKVIVRVCRQCGKQFVLGSSSQKYCSRKCRVISTSPTHWLRDDGKSRAACGNATYWAPLSIEPDEVTCGNCRRHSAFEMASFASAWMLKRW